MMQQRPASPTTTQQWDLHLPMTQQWPARPVTTQQPDPHYPTTRHAPPIDNPDLPWTMHTCHWEFAPAINNLHHPLRGCPILCNLKITMSMHSTNSFFIIFRYLNNQRSPSLSNKSCKLCFTMEGLQIVSIAMHLFQEGHSTALCCIASTGYAM